MKRPSVGDIAVCKAGHVGLVCGIIYKPDHRGISRKLWVGVHVGVDRAGQRWESRSPQKILTPKDFLTDENYQ